MKFLLTASLMSVLLVSCSSDKPKKSSPTPVASTMADPGATQIAPEQMNQTISAWPAESKTLVQSLQTQYGPANEVSANRVVWYKNGQWDMTEVRRAGMGHSLRQSVNMQVPPEKLGEMSMFTNNLIIDQANGIITAVGNSERENFLTLNLAKEVIDGRVSPMEARRQFSAMRGQNERANYQDSLNFAAPDANKQSQEAAPAAAPQQ